MTYGKFGLLSWFQGPMFRRHRVHIVWDEPLIRQLRDQYSVTRRLTLAGATMAILNECDVSLNKVNKELL
jgi:hypothetical protein